MRDLKNRIKVETGAQAALAGTAGLTGASVDLKDCESCTFIAQFATIAAASLAASLTVEESDNNSDWTLVTDANDLVRDGDANPAIDQDGDNTCLTIGYVGNKRYARAKLAVSANNGTDIVSLVNVKGHCKGQP